MAIDGNVEVVVVRKETIGSSQRGGWGCGDSSSPSGSQRRLSGSPWTGFRFVQAHLSARWRFPAKKRRRTTRLTLGILKDFGTCDLVASPDRSATSLRISFGDFKDKDKDKDKDSTRDFNRLSTDIQ